MAKDFSRAWRCQDISRSASCWWFPLSFSINGGGLLYKISVGELPEDFGVHLQRERRNKQGRDKKPFLSDQCKEIEENNRMGKTRNLFKKFRDTKGIFHAKMGLIKDRNGMDLTFQVPIQYCYLQHQTLSPVTSTTGCCFCFGFVSSFILELFLH